MRISKTSLLWVLLLGLNVVAFYIFVSRLFDANSRGILGLGWDQESLQAFLLVKKQFSNIYLGLSYDFINGIGGISFPINPLYSLSFLMASNSNGFITNPTLFFSIAALELYIATIISGYLLKFNLLTTILAAWAISIISWPLFGGLPIIITLWLYIPIYAEFASGMAILIALSLVITQDKNIFNYIKITILFLILTYIILLAPASILFAGLIIFIILFINLISIKNLIQLKIYSKNVFLSIILLFALGYLPYLFGLFSYTAAAFFPDLARRFTPFYGGEVSILLWSPIPNIQSIFQSPERLIVGGGIVGLFLIMFYTHHPVQKKFAKSILFAEVILISIGLLNYRFQFWTGPAIWYFEVYLLPFFSLGLCYLIIFPLILIEATSQKMRQLYAK